MIFVVVSLVLIVFVISWIIVYTVVKSMTDEPGLSKIWASAFGIVFALMTFGILKPWGFVDNYELGYMYNAQNGQLTVLPRTGYIARTPFFESIHTIDLRPRQVCINTNTNGNNNASSGPNSRVLNCKLVKFNPKGLGLFLSWHGRGNYAGEDLDNLLKIYAYDGSGRSYPFLDILRELKSDDAPLPGSVPPPTAKVVS